MANYNDKKEAMRELRILRDHLLEINSERFLLSDCLTVEAKGSSRRIHFDPQSKQGKYLLEAIEFGLNSLINEAESFIFLESKKRSN